MKEQKSNEKNSKISKVSWETQPVNSETKIRLKEIYWKWKNKWKKKNQSYIYIYIYIYMWLLGQIMYSPVHGCMSFQKGTKERFLSNCD